MNDTPALHKYSVRHVLISQMAGPFLVHLTAPLRTKRREGFPRQCLGSFFSVRVGRVCSEYKSLCRTHRFEFNFGAQDVSAGAVLKVR